MEGNVNIGQSLYRQRRMRRNAFLFSTILCFIVFASRRWMVFGGVDWSLLDFCYKFITSPHWATKDDSLLLGELAGIGVLLLLGLIHFIPALISGWFIAAFISLFHLGDSEK